MSTDDPNEDHEQNSDVTIQGLCIEPWKDRERLHTLYWDEELNQAQIAQRFPITQQNVSYWFDKFDLETRDPVDQRNRSISKSNHPKEKVQYHVPDGEGETARFYRHQLVALLEFDAETVFDPDTHVHHEMGAPVAIDTVENLDVLGDREHLHLHGDGYSSDPEEIISFMRDESDEDYGGTE